MPHSKVTVHSMAMDDAMVIDGGTMFDPLQSLGDATRTVTSAENTMRRAKVGVSRFQQVLTAMGAAAVLGMAMMIFAGLVADTLGLANTTSAISAVGMVLCIAGIIAMAFWTVASYDRKVFEKRDVAEEKLHQAQEQYTKIVSMIPESSLLALTATQQEVQDRLKALASGTADG